MALVVLVVHEERPEAVAQADALADALVADGHRVDRSDDPGFAGSEMDDATDLVVSLGGDGSILRAIGLLDGRSARGPPPDRRPSGAGGVAPDPRRRRPPKPHRAGGHSR